MIDLFKRICCTIGWHSFFVGYDPVESGWNGRQACRWCRGIGLVDSPGNLFGVKSVPMERDA